MLKNIRCVFFIVVFFGGEQSSPNLKPFSVRPLSTQHCFKKPGGVVGRLFLVIHPEK
jgi:hypothetical protein